MKYQDFLGQVQARARLSSLDAAVKATRATLTTLGDRLLDTQAHHLASQLPDELRHMIEDRGQESFGFHEFITRVGQREHVDPSHATFHARVVLEVLAEAISAGSLDKLRSSFPPDLRPLLEGSDGHMPKPT